MLWFVLHLRWENVWSFDITWGGGVSAVLSLNKSLKCYSSVCGLIVSLCDVNAEDV